MSAEVAFFLGVAVGAIIAFIVLVIAQAAKKDETVAAQAFKAEDAARAQTDKQTAAIDAKRDQAHATIDQLTPEEIDLVLNGSATLDDVMRKRAAATSAPGVSGSKPTS